MLVPLSLADDLEKSMQSFQCSRFRLVTKGGSEKHCG